MSRSPTEKTMMASHLGGTNAIKVRRVDVTTAADMPAEYSTTPEGTMFSTTPGGTRVVYDRKFLLELRNAPLSQTPPKNLPRIPGITVPRNAEPNAIMDESAKESNALQTIKEDGKASTRARQDSGEDAQFAMDI